MQDFSLHRMKDFLMSVKPRRFLGDIKHNPVQTKILNFNSYIYIKFNSIIKFYTKSCLLPF